MKPVQMPAHRLLLLPGSRLLAESLLNRLAALLTRRHGRVLERLADFAGAACLIVPGDLPAAFLITLQAPPAAPRLQLVDPSKTGQPRATIRAGIATLVELLEGRIDADALFFSRSLAVEGDMEVVVALRNAVDDAGIDLVGDIASAFGPLAAPAERAGRALAGLVARLHHRAAPARGYSA